MIPLAKRLRTERERLGLTLVDVHEGSGVYFTKLSRLERGIGGASLDTLIRLACFYQVSTDYLLGLTDRRRSITRNRK